MRFLLAILVCFGLLSCGKNSSKPNHVSQTRQEQLANLEMSIQSWALYCGDTAAKDGPDDDKYDPPGCETGDAVLFNGLKCAAGDQTACDAVGAAQDEDGRWWRSEFRVGSKNKNPFSRDHGYGAMLYLMATNDTISAEMWMDYIYSNNKRLCTDDDGRCSIRSQYWGLFGAVWDYLGLKKTKEMYLGDIGDETVTKLAAQVTPLGFNLHLVAVDFFVRYYALKDSQTIEKAEQILADRQPNNPFFVWLHEGGTDKVADLVLKYCPTNKPDQRRQWSWERSTAEAAWLDSMGHECLFMIDLLQR